MENNSFEQKVCNIDWTKYSAPEYCDSEMMNYDPSRPVKALIELNQFDGAKTESGMVMSSQILFAMGNDHRGTYYSAALEAIDLITETEKHSDKDDARKCAKDTLNTLFYLQLEMSGENKELYDSINNLTREKLNPYSNENL